MKGLQCGGSFDGNPFDRQQNHSLKFDCYNSLLLVYLPSHTSGETATLAALEVAFDFHKDVEGIYLLTDGKPNSSTTMVLREAANLNMNR